jgi:hypothetical protein
MSYASFGVLPLRVEYTLRLRCICLQKLNFNVLRAIHLIFYLIVGLGLEIPLKRTPSEERDKQYYRLAHDERGNGGAGFVSGRLSLLTFFGEAKKVSAARHERNHAN